MVYFIFRLQSIIKGSHRRTSGKELEAKTMEGCSLLAYPQAHISYRSYITQSHLPRDGAAQNGVYPATSIVNQENAL